jgi:hypothetical protein
MCFCPSEILGGEATIRLGWRPKDGKNRAGIRSASACLNRPSYGPNQAFDQEQSFRVWTNVTSSVASPLS